MKRKKVGIIGLGKITQIKHLHYLFHAEEFQIEAICDISTSLLNSIGELYGVEKRFTNYHEMFKLDLDVVMVLTHDHATPIIDALNAGFHVFTEKPLCWTEEEAEKIQSIVKQTNNKLIIGYMKRYIPNYSDFKDRVQRLENKKIINIKTFASGTKFRIPYSHKTIKDSSLKPLEKDVNSDIITRIMRNMSYSQQRAEDYRMLMELGIHNLNFILDIFGEPVDINYVNMWSSRTENKAFNKNNVKNHRMFITILTFASGLKCVWEIGAFFDGELDWKDTITINDFNEEITLKFPNPFVRGLPIEINSEKIIEGTPVKSSEICFYEDSFKAELQHLFACLEGNEIPKTSVIEGTRDIKWIKKIIDFI
ncbi:Gfo/Idh/MocA family protein [Bacillus sp. CH_442]|uniref:Gfo/Idh/MocA family protein n=1 Tax=Bacillus sp. CH_442 TaxID=2978217 RepID=UPI0030FC0D41|nr:Gfo/Idh/MocA family oxidoreductase [Bacillus thuringiensis]